MTEDHDDYRIDTFAPKQSLALTRPMSGLRPS